jgi:hypothetical protein
MKKFHWPFYLLLAIVIGIVFLFVYPSLAAPYAKKRFKSKWIQVFREHPSTSELRALPESYEIFVREFPDGSWVAARSECVHDSMFNAAVLIDSSHAISTSDFHFCGYEGLAFELSLPKAANLREFYARLEATKIDLHPVP